MDTVEKIAGRAGAVAGFATIMAGFAFLIWWSWDSKQMIVALSAMAGVAAHKMWSNSEET